MEAFVIVVAWLALNVWATSFVSRRAGIDRERTPLYLLTWLLPFFGAVLAVLMPSIRNEMKSTHTTDRMFRAVVEKYQSMRSDSTGN